MIDENAIRHMSDVAFAQFGHENVAYVRPVEIENVACFVLTSAQGRELIVTASREAALAAAYERDLFVVRLH